MENGKPTVSWIELLRWPINIAIFELALGYGVGKALKIYFQPATVPLTTMMLAITLVSLISAYTVSRYMPSDEALEASSRDSFVTVWINISSLLSTFVPLLSILYFDSLVFWSTSVLVASAKALHYLEENRKKTEIRPFFQDIRSQPYSAVTFFGRYVFLPIPDAYALRPLPTAMLFTFSSLGIAFVLVGGKRYIIIGITLIGISSGIYSILSGFARRCAIWPKPNKGVTPYKELH